MRVVLVLRTRPVDLHIFIYKIRDRVSSHEDWPAFSQPARSGFTMLRKFHQVTNGKNTKESRKSYKKDNHYT